MMAVLACDWCQADPSWKGRTQRDTKREREGMRKHAVGRSFYCRNYDVIWHRPPSLYLYLSLSLERCRFVSFPLSLSFCITVAHENLVNDVPRAGPAHSTAATSRRPDQRHHPLSLKPTHRFAPTCSALSRCAVYLVSHRWLSPVIRLSIGCRREWRPLRMESTMRSSSERA